jgi:hypothetical protein
MSYLNEEVNCTEPSPSVGVLCTQCWDLYIRYVLAQYYTRMEVIKLVEFYLEI